LDAKGIEELLKEADAQDIKKEGQWVMSRCPFSPYERAHRFRMERNRSFGVSVHDNDGKFSVYNCFTCKAQGTLKNLFERLASLQGEDYDEIIEGLDVSEELGGPLGKFKEAGKRVEEQAPEPISKMHEDLYDPCPEDHPYLETRGITAETCKRLQLKIDESDKDGDERILFPVWDDLGNFFGYSGRAVHEDHVGPKVRDYFGLAKRACLLGSHLHEGEGVVLLTEGLLDYARGQELGYFTVATMHSGLTDYQAKILIRMSLPVYGFLDNDAAGREGNLMAAKKISPHLPFMAVRWPKGIEDLGDTAITERMIDRMVDKAQIYRIQ